MSRSQRDALDFLDSMKREHLNGYPRGPTKRHFTLGSWAIPQCSQRSSFNPFLWDSVNLRLYNAAMLRNTAAAKPLPTCRVVYEVIARRCNAQNHADETREIQPMELKVEKRPILPSFSLAAVAALEKLLTTAQPELGTNLVNSGHPNPVEALLTGKGSPELLGTSPGLGRPLSAQKSAIMQTVKVML